MNRIVTTMPGGRFLSRHLAALIYHDGQHKVIKVRLSEGGFMELIQARQEDGSFRPQMLSYVTTEDEHILINV